MKSLRVRLTLWGAAGFTLVAIAFTYVLHLDLESELLQTAATRKPANPSEWQLRHNLTEAEVHQVADTVLRSAQLWLIPVILTVAAGGYWLARQSLRPIVNVNRQLQTKHPGNLGEPIELPELDHELRDLLRQLNELLIRLDSSFVEMNNYAAKVAHELRTPITIMRLKVEQAGSRIAPELADELEGELHRLSHVVEQSLLIARAEQGRVVANPAVFNLAETVRDVVEDFQLLAAERKRVLTLKACPNCWVSADPRHVRQITHTLLTNALKHGSGGLVVRLRPKTRTAVLLVANPASHDGTTEPTLGLGLRVVAALLRLEPGLSLQRRHTRHYHVARLVVPLIERPASFQI